MSTPEHERLCDDILHNLAHIVSVGADPRETHRAAIIRVRLHGSPEQRQRLSAIEDVAERVATANRLEAKAAAVQMEPEIERQAETARAVERRAWLEGKE